MARRRTSDEGIALPDLLMALLLTLTMLTMAVPFTSRARDTHEARGAAAYLASRVREVRLAAVASNRTVALVFDQGPAGWALRRCSDGNGNGVRRAELAGGPDDCRAGQQLAGLLGISLGLDPTVPGIDEPAGRTDGVRFGRSAMTSCSPAGHCTPGTLYLRSPGGQQFAVRVAPVMGRTRLFRFDPAGRRWEPL